MLCLNLLPVELVLTRTQRYEQSPKGKATRKAAHQEYAQSDGGRAALKRASDRYCASDKGKASRRKNLRTWKQRHPEKILAYAHSPKGKAQQKKSAKKWELRTKYGLTPEQYSEMLAAQNGVCAICREPPPADILLSVDHCHRTSHVRGLLCKPCNLAIGNMKDDAARLRAAANYVENAGKSE